MKNVWDIRRIENLTEAEAAKMTIEKMTVKKDYTCYFIDFGGYFGYSVCVFADGQHLNYVNDYELHHRGKSREELRGLYIKKLNKALYTLDELETVQNYEDFSAKDYFIRNHYSMRRPRLSAFQIFHSDAEERAFDAETKKMTFSSVGMAYYDDADFVRHLSELCERLNAAKAAHDNDRAYWEDAFLSEMHNHEYEINWQADYDVISAFANVDSVKDYTNVSELFELARFSTMQQAAYMDARRAYYKQQQEEKNENI